MHPKVLSREGWQTVRRLVGEGVLDGWTLAGGTGLALQLGHRYSEDLDFFRAESFDAERLIEGLSAVGDVAVQSRSPDTVHATVEGLRVSLLRAQAPLLFPGTEYRGLVVADPRDIAIMKVVAIGGRGSRKDFIDLYFYLRAGGDLEAILALVGRRFSDVDYNEYHLLKSLVYFEDAESEPMPEMIRRISWETTKETIVAAVRRLSP